MMMYATKKTALFFLLALAGGVALWAATRRPEKATSQPDPFTEYREVLLRSGIADAKIHISGSITYYDPARPEETRQLASFESIKDNSSFFSSLAGLTTIGGDGYVVAVDSLNKTVTLSKTDTSMMQMLEAGPQMLTRLFGDTAINKMSATLSTEGNQRVLTVENESTPAIQSFRMYYDPKTYALDRVLVKWWREKAASETLGQNVVVTDIKYHFKSFHGFAKTQTVQGVVVINGNSITLTPPYKEYSLQTQL